MTRYPLLKNCERGYLPRNGRCLICHKKIRHVVVTLSAGAVYDIDPDKKQDEPLLEGFWYLSFHTSNTDCKDNAWLEIVRDLVGGQFDLQFCSTKCLRVFFAKILRDFENRIELAKGRIPRARFSTIEKFLTRDPSANP